MLFRSMELEDSESNKKRKIEEAKETERLSPFRSTEEEKDSTTGSFDTAVQGEKTAVIDKGAAVIYNEEGVVLKEKELDTEDDVKVAADPNLLEHAKKSEHDSKVLLTEQWSPEQRLSLQDNEDLERQGRILKIFEQQDKMDYLKYEEMMEQGGVIELTDDHRVSARFPC